MREGESPSFFHQRDLTCKAIIISISRPSALSGHHQCARDRALQRTKNASVNPTIARQSSALGFRMAYTDGSRSSKTATRGDRKPRDVKLILQYIHKATATHISVNHNYGEMAEEQSDSVRPISQTRESPLGKCVISHDGGHVVPRQRCEYSTIGS